MTEKIEIEVHRCRMCGEISIPKDPARPAYRCKHCKSTLWLRGPRSAAEIREQARRAAIIRNARHPQRRRRKAVAA